MAKARTLVGLDVHAAKVVAAVLDAETGELRFQRLGGETEPVVRLVSSLEAPVRASYEATSEQAICPEARYHALDEPKRGAPARAPHRVVRRITQGCVHRHVVSVRPGASAAPGAR